MWKEEKGSTRPERDGVIREEKKKTMRSKEWRAPKKGGSFVLADHLGEEEEQEARQNQGKGPRRERRTLKEGAKGGPSKGESVISPALRVWNKRRLPSSVKLPRLRKKTWKKGETRGRNEHLVTGGGGLFGGLLRIGQLERKSGRQGRDLGTSRKNDFRDLVKKAVHAGGFREVIKRILLRRTSISASKENFLPRNRHRGEVIRWVHSLGPPPHGDLIFKEPR